MQQQDELVQVFSIPLGAWLYLAWLLDEPYQDIPAIVKKIEDLVQREHSHHVSVSEELSNLCP